jgi:hypothetical protein
MEFGCLKNYPVLLGRKQLLLQSEKSVIVSIAIKSDKSANFYYGSQQCYQLQKN